MDVFVMPSLWEGLPLSMILAMGAGMPVVATEVCGHSRDLSSTARPDGSLRPATRSPLATALLSTVFADRVRAARVGKAAR